MSLSFSKFVSSVVFFSLLSFSLSAADLSPEQIEKIQIEAERFLKVLGFDDYVAMIQNSLDTDKSLNDVQRESLESNKKRYEVINSARKLAIKLAVALERHHGTKDEKEFLDTALWLAARGLSLQPINPDTEFPAEVENLPESKKADAKKKSVVGDMSNKILAQTYATTSNFVHTLQLTSSIEDLLKVVDNQGQFTPEEKAQAKEFLEIRDLVKDNIKFMWLDSTLGQTRFMGRALVLVIEAFSRRHPELNLHSRLIEAARLQGYDLSNFVGDVLHIEGLGGKIHKHRVRTGERIFERTREGEAAQIVAAAGPHWGRWLFAYWHGLIGTLRGMIYPAGEGVAPKDLSVPQRLRLWISGLRSATRGVSHIGTAYVAKDPVTKIKVAWGLDNYPGGVRFIGIMDAFAQPGVFMKAGFAYDDPYKLWDLLHAQVEKRKKIDPDGYVEALWASDLPYTDANGKIIDASKVKWPTMISRENFKRLFAIPREQAKEFQKEILALIAEHIRVHMMTKQGTRFSHGFNDLPGELYCASTFLVAGMQAVGVDFQLKPDQFRPLIKWLARLSHTKYFKNIKIFDSLRDLNIDQRIVAPNGLAAADSIGGLKLIRYPKMTSTEQARSLSRTILNPMDSKAFGATLEGSIILTRFLKQSGDIDLMRLEIDDEIAESVISAIESNFTKHQKFNNVLASGARGGHSVLDTCTRAILNVRREVGKWAL